MSFITSSWLYVIINNSINLSYKRVIEENIILLKFLFFVLFGSLVLPTCENLRNCFKKKNSNLVTCPKSGYPISFNKCSMLLENCVQDPCDFNWIDKLREWYPWYWLTKDLDSMQSRKCALYFKHGTSDFKNKLEMWVICSLSNDFDTSTTWMHVFLDDGDLNPFQCERIMLVERLKCSPHVIYRYVGVCVNVRRTNNLKWLTVGLKKIRNTL